MCRDGPAFTIAARPPNSSSITKQSQQPGPGEYIVEGAEHGRAFSFVKATRQTLRVGSEVPGPGNYEIPGKDRGPAWSIPLASRGMHDERDDSDQPAPGEYEPQVSTEARP
jgi:hypothetical protein